MRRPLVEMDTRAISGLNAKSRNSINSGCTVGSPPERFTVSSVPSFSMSPSMMPANSSRVMW